MCECVDWFSQLLFYSFCDIQVSNEISNDLNKDPNFEQHIFFISIQLIPIKNPNFDLASIFLFFFQKLIAAYLQLPNPQTPKSQKKTSFRPSDYAQPVESDTTTDVLRTCHVKGD